MRILEKFSLGLQILTVISLSHSAATQGTQAECPSSSSYDTVPVNRILELGINSYQDSKSPSTFPCWFDVELARTGQRFASKNFGNLFFANSLSSIVLLSDHQIRRILLLARKSHDPGDTAKTAISTVQQFLLWYQSDILSPEWLTSVQNVRKIHSSVTASIKKRDTDLNRKSALEDNAIFRSKPDEIMWNAFKRDLKALDTEENRRKYIPANNVEPVSVRFNQYTQALSLWAFMAMPVLSPEELGISNSNDRDLQGFVHLWTTVAYAVGMEDKFIYCKNPTAQWEECKQYLRDLFTSYYLPQLLDLGFEAKVFIENTFRGVRELSPGYPNDAYLITLLEKHLGVRAEFLRRQQSWRSILFGTTASWLTVEATRLSPTLQTLYNDVFSRILQSSSVKYFGDPGTNSTIVADSHFSWKRDKEL